MSYFSGGESGRLGIFRFPRGLVSRKKRPGGGGEFSCVVPKVLLRWATLFLEEFKKGAVLSLLRGVIRETMKNPLGKKFWEGGGGGIGLSLNRLPPNAIEGKRYLRGEATAEVHINEGWIESYDEKRWAKKAFWGEILYDTTEGKSESQGEGSIGGSRHFAKRGGEKKIFGGMRAARKKESSNGLLLSVKRREETQKKWTEVILNGDGSA